MIKGIIYKVTHKKSGKNYIGATTKSLDTRKKDHTERANRGGAGMFQSAIATYGPEAFSWTQVDTAISTDELAKKEKAYIQKYNAKEEGFNSDNGGGIQKTVYQYDKNGNLIDSFSCLANACSAVSAAKSSISKAALEVNKTCNGYYWSYSSTFPNHLTDLRKKKVHQFSIQGEFINEFNSVSEASSITGFNKTSIAKVCRGTRKQCGTYVWKYI